MSSLHNHNNSVPSLVIGLNAFHADSSAAIFKDGTLIAAIEEERFTRRKHWAGFPVRSISFCLQEVGASINDVEAFAVGRDPRAKFFKKLLFSSKNPRIGSSLLRQRWKNRSDITGISEQLQQIDESISSHNADSKLFYVEHHLAHLASSFYSSNFSSATLLSIDGSGDFSTSMIGVGNDTTIETLDSTDFPHSIGLLYTAFTQFLGFPHYGDEYKVMGLAPYGNPVYTDEILKIAQITTKGKIRLDLSYFNLTDGVVSYRDNMPVVSQLFSERFRDIWGQPRIPGNTISQVDMDIAASIQKATEELIFALIDHAIELTGIPTLCLSGGVAQNSVANGKILTHTKAEDLYIPSAGHDAGIAYGSAQYYIHNVNGCKRTPPIYSAYLGSSYETEAIISECTKHPISHSVYDNFGELCDVVSDHLVNGAVIGWFSGRAEFGPRALGARSILADPSRQDAKELINSKIKRRESFRPFAPSILEEHVESFFEETQHSPFMERVLTIRPEKRDTIPAVTHVDGTGRLQTVSSINNPKYHQLISTFYSKTGIPLLLNTSFNENEPIVNHPSEALYCFLRTDMDFLVLDNVLVQRTS